MKGNGFGGRNSGGPYGGKLRCTTKNAALNQAKNFHAVKLITIMCLVLFFQVAMAQVGAEAAMVLGDINSFH